MDVLEDVLGLNISGGDQPNTLLFRFRLVDPQEPEREFKLVADISEYEYKSESDLSLFFVSGGIKSKYLIHSVTRCDPAIPNLGEMIQELNDDRNIMAFIRRGKSNQRIHVGEELRS